MDGMFEGNITMNRWMSVLLSATVVATGLGSFANVQADVEMNDRFKEFVLVQVTTPVSTQSANVGEPFGIKLMETVHYEDQTLPLGSTFDGKITEAREPKRWGRPARFKVLFDELNLPLKPDAIALEPSDADEQDDMEAIFLHDNRHTYNTLVSRQAIVAAAANAVTIPLSLLLHQGLTTAWIMDDSVDAVAGVVTELRFNDPNDTRSKKRKIWDGALRGGTPIPLITGMARKGDTLEYTEEEATVYLRLPKDLWSVAFTQLAQANASHEKAQTSVEGEIQQTADEESSQEVAPTELESERLRN